MGLDEDQVLEKYTMSKNSSRTLSMVACLLALLSILMSTVLFVQLRVESVTTSEIETVKRIYEEIKMSYGDEELVRTRAKRSPSQHGIIVTQPNCEPCLKVQTGPRGPSGDKGDRGDRGPVGEMGVTGSTGEKGDRGDPGYPGQKGGIGFSGQDGKTGAHGSPGEKGESGPVGQKGEPGKPCEKCVSDLIPPSFTEKSKKVLVKEGDNIRLECVAAGKPTPIHKWSRKDGLTIHQDGYQYPEILDTLTFKNIRMQENGTYTCTADNGVGSPAVMEYHIIVEPNKLDGFRVTFGWSEVMKDREHFFTIPRTASEAGEYGFKAVSEIRDELGLQARCLDDDLRVCPLYDTAGSVAGLHIAIPACDLRGTPTDLTTKLKLKSIKGSQYWTATQYVVSPDIIKAGGRQSLLSTVSEGIWLRTGDQITELPIKEEELKATNFRKQNCIPNMGTHYYNNLTAESNCSDLFPFFVLVKEGQVIGTGFQIFGKTKQDGMRPWFEKPSSKIRNAALPNAPACMGSWVEQYGMITLHIYYVDKPWSIRCEDSDSVQPISYWDKLSLKTLRYANIGYDEAKISTGRIIHPNNSSIV